MRSHGPGCGDPHLGCPPATDGCLPEDWQEGPSGLPSPSRSAASCRPHAGSAGRGPLLPADHGRCPVPSSPVSSPGHHQVLGSLVEPPLTPGLPSDHLLGDTHPVSGAPPSPPAQGAGLCSSSLSCSTLSLGAPGP